MMINTIDILISSFRYIGAITAHLLKGCCDIFKSELTNKVIDLIAWILLYCFVISQVDIFLNSFTTGLFIIATVVGLFKVIRNIRGIIKVTRNNKSRVNNK